MKPVPHPWLKSLNEALMAKHIPFRVDVIVVNGAHALRLASRYLSLASRHNDGMVGINVH